MNQIPDVLLNFLISKNLTEDISADLDEYTGEKLKYTQPVDPDSFEVSEDYWHLPLISI